MARNGAEFFWNSYMMGDYRDRAPREYATTMFSELNPIKESMLENWVANEAPQQLTRKYPVCAPVCAPVCCVFCGGSHTFDHCPSNPELVFYLGHQGFNHENWYSNTYNHGWKTHQNSMWSGQDTYSNFEQVPNETFYSPWVQNQQQQESPQPSLTSTSHSLEEIMMEYMAKNDVVLQNLKLQVEQLAKEIQSQHQSGLPNDTGNSLQSGKEPEVVTKFTVNEPSSMQQEQHEPKESELPVEDQVQSVETNVVGNVAENATGNFAENAVGYVAAKQLQNLPEQSIVVELEKWEELIVEYFAVNIFVVKSAENEILLFYDNRMCDLLEGNASDEVENQRYDFVPKEVVKRRVIKWPWLKVSTVHVDF